MMETLQTIVSGSPDAMIAVEDGLIVAANSLACDMFGYDTLEGLPLEQLVPHEAKVIHQKKRTQYQAKPRRRHMGSGERTYAVRKNGSRFVADVTLMPYETRRQGDVDKRNIVIASIRNRSERIEEYNSRMSKVRRFFATRRQGSPFLFLMALLFAGALNFITVSVNNTHISHNQNQSAQATRALARKLALTTSNLAKTLATEQTTSLVHGCYRTAADKATNVQDWRTVSNADYRASTNPANSPAEEKSRGEEAAQISYRNVTDLDPHIDYHWALPILPASIARIAGVKRTDVITNTADVKAILASHFSCSAAYTPPPPPPTAGLTGPSGPRGG